MKVVAYEIGYWSNDEWVSCSIVTKRTTELYPEKLGNNLKYHQSWEMTPEKAKRINCVGYMEQPHLPGSTVVRRLIVG